MPDREEDERYDTSEEYKSNKNVLENFNKNIRGEDYDIFSSSVVNEDMENGTKIIDDCITLKKYLLYFETIESCNSVNCCEFINYWLNKKDKTYNNTMNSPIAIYNQFMKEDSQLKEKNLCISKINKMKTDIYERMDKLYKIYEYYKNYKNYKLQNNNIQLACNRAMLCATEYNSKLSKNAKIDDTKFCKILEDFKEEFENDVLLFKSQCNIEIPNLVSYKESCTYPQKQKIGADSTLHIIARDGERVRTFNEASYEQSQQTLNSAEKNNTSPSSLGATLPIALFSSGIGALLILLSFYKFTALGQFLRHSIQKFKGISKNIGGEEYEMNQHISEYDENNSEYNEYNIIYNSF